jgi:sugar phosphate isomerase/epimerase
LNEEQSVISRRDLILRAPFAAAMGTAWACLARAAEGPRNPVACQTNAWQIKPGDFPGLLSRVADLKRLGFVAFECNVRFVKEQFPRAREARAEIERTGVRFYGPHVGLGFAEGDLMRWIDGAASLGAERFALSGGGKSLVAGGRLDRTALDAKVAEIGRLAERCRRAGIRLVYHNHGQEFARDGAEIEALLQQTDPATVSLLFDVGHAFREEADVPAFFARHQRRIDALHLRDLRGGRQVPLGEGEFDFEALAEAIRRAEWPGYLTLEEESLKSDDLHYVESVLQAGRQRIRKFFGV